MRSKIACGGTAACAPWSRGTARAALRATPGAGGPVLDAGCGTGGMLARLGAVVAGRPTLGLEYDPIAAAPRRGQGRRGRSPAGSVNEMPLGDGVARRLRVARRAVPWRGRPRRARSARRDRCLEAGRDRAVQSAGLSAGCCRRMTGACTMSGAFIRGQARALLAGHGFRILEIDLLEHAACFP